MVCSKKIIPIQSLTIKFWMFSAFKDFTSTPCESHSFSILCDPHPSPAVTNLPGTITLGPTVKEPSSHVRSSILCIFFFFFLYLHVKDCSRGTFKFSDVRLGLLAALQVYGDKRHCCVCFIKICRPVLSHR